MSAVGQRMGATLTRELTPLPDMIEVQKSIEMPFMNKSGQIDLMEMSKRLSKDDLREYLELSAKIRARLRGGKR